MYKHTLKGHRVICNFPAVKVPSLHAVAFPFKTT